MREHSKQLTSVEQKLPDLYTLITKKWKAEFLDFYNQLKKWEIEHVGELQFTNSFSSVAEFLETGPKRSSQSDLAYLDDSLPLTKRKKKNIKRHRNRSLMDEDPTFHGGYGMPNLPSVNYPDDIIGD